MSYVPRLVKSVNLLAIRQVKQGTETARFRYPYELYSAVFTRVNMLALYLIPSLKLKVTLFEFCII